MRLHIKVLVSCLALVLCLVVCIEEIAEDLCINYKLKGVNMQDVEYALSELEKWKKEHNFMFDIGKKGAKLRLYFTDATKKSVNIISSNITDDVKHYEGLFTYYTVKNGEPSRRFKIDDIQLGELDISLLNLDDYANKKCSIILRDDKVIFCSVLEGGLSNG